MHFLFFPAPPPRAVECRSCEKKLEDEGEQWQLPHEGVVCLDCYRKIDLEIEGIVPAWFNEPLPPAREKQLLAKLETPKDPPLQMNLSPVCALCGDRSDGHVHLGKPMCRTCHKDLEAGEGPVCVPCLVKNLEAPPVRYRSAYDLMKPW